MKKSQFLGKIFLAVGKLGKSLVRKVKIKVFARKIFLGLMSFLVLNILFVVQHSALAGGFKLPVQNVTNMGVAYAGTAALAIDASTNFFNPAGLVRLDQEQVVFAGVLNLPYTRVEITRATSNFGNVLSPPGGRAVPINSSFVPSFHYAKRINDDWVFGFSSVTVFGTRTLYTPTSVVRYMATRSELVTMDLAPSLAYSFENGFSIGAGLNALFAKSRLDSRIGTGNHDTDGMVKTRVQNWGYGYHAGILYEFNDCTRVGFNYHSHIAIYGKGKSRIQPTASSPITVQGIYAKLTLPEFATFSVYHALNEQFAVMADVQWVRWDRFKQVILKFDNNTQYITTPNYKNSYFVALGGTYQFNDCWQFKLGGAFDKTPTVDGSRPIYNPDQNQFYAAIGAQYRFNSQLAFELGYVHVFYQKAINDLSPPISVGLPQGGQSIQGASRSHIEVFGLQVTWDIV